ncbi:sigma-54-dependent Fis family transcriptional regulator [Oceanobacillus sp. AG]|uniref:sigma-54 interaction domain-containing protein n=1 Tax=Oceanobacillus sp. AG TaxID=2681969 RepID=UPI0018DC6D71|nr:sigma 54-interacting transcriptional regulator [Oceanobacillus sp. AG]
MKRVLETGEKQTLIQETRSGKKLLVTGNIVYNDKNNIKYVVTYAQDVTELEKMKLYVKMIEGEMETIKSELKELQSKQSAAPHIIAKSEPMKHVVSLINRVARSNTSVLLTGESGVGKTLLAEYLHNQSGRKGKFVTINCSSIPESLLESELFGYDAGAFTGANPKGKKGLVEEAKGGTLFLDEIGELPMNLQAKLLTFTQSKEFIRVGETTPISLDFRLVTATNVNLKERIEDGKFREDLYFRLSVIHIPIPPLRERREDLLSLIIELTQKFNQRHQQEKVLDHAVIDHLLHYKWPGNVRELANLMERLVLTIDDNLIQQEHIPKEFISNYQKENSLRFQVLEEKTLPEMMQELETQILQKAFASCKSTTEMARQLGVSQPTVVRKLQKYGIKKTT